MVENEKMDLNATFVGIQLYLFVLGELFNKLLSCMDFDVMMVIDYIDGGEADRRLLHIHVKSAWQGQLR